MDAELQGRTVLGDRKVGLAPVQRLAGTLLVVVRAKAIFGDLRCAAWRRGTHPAAGGALMERLTQRRQLPPPPPGAPAPFPPPPF